MLNVVIENHDVVAADACIWLRDANLAEHG